MSFRNSVVGVLTVPALVILGACSDDTNATPQVVFDGQLTTGNHSSATCGEGGQGFDVGAFANLNLSTPEGSAPVKDGDEFEGTRVSVACSVVGAGANTFNVSGTVDLAGSSGGVFRVDGQFTTTGDQNNIHAFFSRRASGNSYDETDRQCTVRYTTSVQGVVAGRVWGEIDCPNMYNANADRTCGFKAQFRFENCAQ